MCVCEYYLCMRSQVTLWHTFVYLWQRHHYTALSPHDPLTPITHYHKNNTTYFFSALLSALIMSGCQDVSVMSAQSWVTRTRVTTETDISDKNFKDVGLSIIELLALESSLSRERRPMNDWPGGSGLVWGLSLSLFTKPTIPIVPLSPARCKDVRMSSQH